MTEIEKGEINIFLYSFLRKGARGVCNGETIGIFLETFTRRDKNKKIIDKHTENYVVYFLGKVISHEILHREIYKEGIKVSHNAEEGAVREVIG